MASREFVAVTWSPDQLVDEDSLDQINSNLIFLRNQMVNGGYMHLNNGVTSTGIKMLCGRKIIAPVKSDTASARVAFAKMFTPDSVPVITTAVNSPGGKVKIFSVISGIGQDQPNHQGFEVKVNVAADSASKDVISKPLYINWIAMGY